MKKFSILFVVPLFISCGGQSETTTDNSDTTNIQKPLEPCLICVRDADYNPAFVNEKGDTIIPFGKYSESFQDTIYTFGSVYDTARSGFFAIDLSGSELFEVFAFENGPDYIEEGTFRIVKDDKIGYANEAGEIIIEPQYTCAFPFQDGKAKVALNCTETLEFEMTKWESDEWFFINQAGEIVPE